MLSASENVATAPPCIEIGVDDLPKHRDLLEDILTRRLGGVIVRGVYPPELLAAAIEQLQGGRDDVPQFRPHTIRKGAVYGWPLVGCDEVLDAYLDDARRFDAACASLFGLALRPAARVAEILAGLSGGRPVSVPKARDGRDYCAATIRFLSDGDSLPIHTENETFQAKPLRDLSPRLDRASLMSFYVPMALASAGGELRLYNVDCFEGGGGLIGRMGGNEEARPYFESRGYTVLRPGVGDLLLFDGGRQYHEVTELRGARWTMGGVFAFTADHRAVHFWS
jgi:hypothetical protein